MNCLSLGTTPAGVTWPPGAISVTLSPSRTKSERASSMPSTMPNSPGTSFASAPCSAVVEMSVTCGSSSGTMPRTSAPFMSSPRAIKRLGRR